MRSHAAAGGFSQGGAMTYYAGLSYPKPLGGLVVLSGYLPLRKDFPGVVHDANRRTPMFVAHGTADTLLPHALGRASASIVEGAGCNVNFRTYDMPHSTHPREIADLRAWLNDRLPIVPPKDL
jgi:phospholipase/carboxylesterase